MKETQPAAATTTSVPYPAKMKNAEPTADASPFLAQATVIQTAAKDTAHEDFDVTIIWQNIDSRSNFMMFRKESRGPIERILVDFATVLESGVIDQIISVNASKHLFCVTLATEKNKEDGVLDQIMAVL
ncbi:hypothetical protein BKA63DRAFT_273286 [Paraphoma chrysanthemicola]|nr:hypothetical protein BKA63DRAFT_273286 [Paraphoma chrysanthemicola]